MKRWKICLCCLFCAVLLVQGVGMGHVAMTKEEWRDYETLLHARDFSYGATGAGGEMSKTTKAYQRLFSSKNAKAYFTMLEAEGNSQSKLYALCALYYLDYGYYKMLMERYKNATEEVSLLSGCLGNQDKMCRIIKREEDSQGFQLVRLSGPDDTIDAWRARNGGASTISVDFYGGGIPALMREYIGR